MGEHNGNGGLAAMFAGAGHGVIGGVKVIGATDAVVSAAGTARIS
ncbi:hypothetical protein YK56LOC_68470 [Caballeronia sp. HLA56]